MAKDNEIVALVAGVMRRDRSVFFARRSQNVKWYKGLWDLPGGHVEPGESDRQAIARELKEEIGVETVQVSEEPIDTLREYSKSGDVLATLSVWEIVVWHGEPREAELGIHDEFAWVPLSDIPRLQLAHPEYADLLVEEHSIT